MKRPRRRQTDRARVPPHHAVADDFSHRSFSDNLSEHAETTKLMICVGRSHKLFIAEGVDGLVRVKSHRFRTAPFENRSSL